MVHHADAVLRSHVLRQPHDADEMAKYEGTDRSILAREVLLEVVLAFEAVLRRLVDLPFEVSELEVLDAGDRRRGLQAT